MAASIPPTWAPPSSAWTPVRIRSYLPFCTKAFRMIAMPFPSDPSKASSESNTP